MRVAVTPFFRWFDLWIGAYVDVPNRTLYVCPVPMLGLKIKLSERPFRPGDRVIWVETDERFTVKRVEGGAIWGRFDDSDQEGWVPATELRHAA
jgi:hypothetical protein